MQISLIQIDNYGPWTTTPNPKPESQIQTLQSRIYSDICQLLDGLVFFARFDNMIAVSDATIKDYKKIQESIRNRYPITISIGIGSGKTPREAIRDATDVLQKKGSAQDPNRKEVLATGKHIKNIYENTGDIKSENSDSVAYTEKIQVAHFDEIDATDRLTDNLDAFQATLEVEKCYSVLAQEMWKNYDSMTFFVGGDNFISITPGINERDFRKVVEKVKKRTGSEIKVGVGNGKLSDAGMKAKIALEKCRETDEKVVFEKATSV